MENCELLEIRQSLDLSAKSPALIEERIDTGFGPILVAHEALKSKSTSSQCCIVTFHDLGLNYLSNFQAFFNYHLMRPVVRRMPVIHINAPGQEDGASELDINYEYPSMDQLADCVRTVCNYYNIRQSICIGVGLGANVMSRVALKNPDIVDGLFLINPVPTIAGWLEWGYQKRNIYYLNSVDHSPGQMSLENGDNLYYGSSIPQTIIDYLIWYHFGNQAEERNMDLVNIYKKYFSNQKIPPRNLALLIDSYLKRDDIGVTRDEGQDINCSCLVLCGSHSPFFEDSINMNQRLRPERSTWMKLSDCGAAMEEQPDKVAEAFILFVQGLGLGLLTCYRYK